jgi:3'(2'), 5'-bisphosphate nucleotidase
LSKDDRSPVTVADFGSQAIVCRVLAERFPADPVMAEEDSGALRQVGNEPMLAQVVEQVGRLYSSATPENVCDWIDRGNLDMIAERYWILDPIDGTKGFLRGDQYAIALALVEAGELRVAALACPRLASQADGGAEHGGAEFGGAQLGGAELGGAEYGDARYGGTLYGGEESCGSDGTVPVGVVFTAVRGQGASEALLSAEGAGRPIAVSSAKEPSDVRLCESVEPSHSHHALAAAVLGRLRAADPDEAPGCDRTAHGGARDELGEAREPNRDGCDTHGDRVAGAMPASVRLDSQAKYGVVARGGADLYLRLPRRTDYVERVWDHAAGALVVTEAGGTVTDVAGRPLDFTRGSRLLGNRGVVVSNGHLHALVIEALAREVATGS